MPSWTLTFLKYTYWRSSIAVSRYPEPLRPLWLVVPVSLLDPGRRLRELVFCAVPRARKKPSEIETKHSDYPVFLTVASLEGRLFSLQVVCRQFRDKINLQPVQSSGTSPMLELKISVGICFDYRAIDGFKEITTAWLMLYAEVVY